MNRAKQLKNKIEEYAPEIFIYGTAIITLGSLLYAVYTNDEMKKLKGQMIVAVEKTEEDYLLLFKNNGSYLIGKIEDLPVNIPATIS